MKKLNLLFLLLAPLFALGETDEFKKLFCKTWEVTGFVEKGKERKPTAEEAKVTLTFNKDNTYKSSDPNEFPSGNWAYAEKDKTVNLTIAGYPKALPMKVIKLEASEMILELDLGEGANRMIMKPR